jgi:TonB family protein
MHQRELHFVLPETRTNVGTVFSGAGAIYVFVAALVTLILWVRPPTSPLTALVPASFDSPPLTFLNIVGPTGGGGGGGDRSRQPVPIRTSPVPAITPPAAPPTIVPPDVLPPPDFIPVSATVPAIASSLDPASFDPSRPPTPGPLGSGENGAGGPGPGGVGPGREAGGVGPGPGGPNTGPGPGGGGGVDQQVQLLQMQKPGYTSAAMMHKAQGEVTLSCTVLATGRVGGCRVVRSLDSNAYGLDDEAIKAAMRFVFKPATRQGKPVPVQVNIVIEFTMR